MVWTLQPSKTKTKREEGQASRAQKRHEWPGRGDKNDVLLTEKQPKDSLKTF